jgi:hypothetical protein
MNCQLYLKSKGLPKMMAMIKVNTTKHPDEQHKI